MTTTRKRDVRRLNPGDVFITSDFNADYEPLRYRVTGQPRALPIRGITMLPAVLATNPDDESAVEMGFVFAEKVDVEPAPKPKTALPDRQDAVTFLRNTIAASPKFGNDWEVVNIEQVHPGTLVFDLDDGTTIRVDITRYPTDPDDLGRGGR